MQAVRSSAIGIAISLGLHAALWFVVVAFGAPPELEFELEIPMDLELGMSDEMMAAEAPSPAGEPPPEATETEADATEGGSEAGAVDAGPRDAGPPDAGPPDTGPPDTGPEEAEGEGELHAEGDGESRIPPGAQIAIRIDMARVRASALAPDVRSLLSEIPDWRLILQGSGLDPLRDTERLLLASPNLQRAQWVIAGTVVTPEGQTGGEVIRGATSALAESQSQTAAWRTQRGVPVARWHNQDATERIIAILGPRHFVICRPQDLERVLAIARARESSARAANAPEESTDDPEASNDEGDEGANAGTEEAALEEATGADALLAMGIEAALTIEVEGARRFVRVGRQELVPQSLRANVRHADAAHVTLTASATYENAEEAETALAYWEEQRRRAAANPFVRLSGMNRPLSDGRLEREGSRLDIELTLTIGQTRLLLGYLEGAIVARARRRDRAAASMRGGSAETETPGSAMEPSAMEERDEGEEGQAPGE